MSRVVEDKKVCDVSEVLEKFGKYQKIQYIYTCLPAIFITMININYIFIAGNLNYRCQIPECGNEPDMEPTWWPNKTIDRCKKPVLNYDLLVNNTCTKSSFTDQLEKCTHWVYESDDTIVAELDLACQPWKSNLVGTVHNIGMLVSMIFSGWMSDRFGRKPTLILCAVGSCVGHLKAFAKSYYAYIALEFAESAISAGTYPAAMVLMIEIGGKRNRILAGVIFSYAVYIGESIFACVAMVVPYWKNLVRIIYSPSIFFVLLIFLLRESPRWQILNGKFDKAKETIAVAANMNNVPINLNELYDIDEAKLKEKFKIYSYEKREGFKAIVKSREIMKRVLVASVCRFTSVFVYYGLMINSVWLPGNKHTNFLLSTAMSFPGEILALYLMNKIGRKRPLIVGFLICGFICGVMAYIPDSYTSTKVIVFLIGKVIISICFTGAITYSMELFPTSARGSLLGLCAFASRAGGMLAPLTPMLMFQQYSRWSGLIKNTASPLLHYIVVAILPPPFFSFHKILILRTVLSPSLPSVFFGCPAVISGILLSLTPETKDLPLYDTIEQVQTSVNKKKTERSFEEGTDNFDFEESTVTSL